MSTNILLIAASGTIMLALLLVATMIYFLNSLTDAILLNTLRAVSKTAAKGVEENIHILSDRLVLLRDSNNFDIYTPDRQRYVLEAARFGVEYVWLGLYDMEGNLEAGTDDSPENIYLWEFWDLLQTTDNVTVSDTKRTVNGLEVVLGEPVWNALGKTRHYLLCAYKYDVLNDILNNTDVGVNSSTYIINRDARIMAHQDQIKALDYADFWRRFSDIDEFTATLEQMNYGQTGALRLTPKNGVSYLCYAPVRGTNWTLVVEASKSDFSGPVRQAIAISVAMTPVLLLLLAYVLYRVLRRLVTKPLEQITENATQMAEGRLIHAVPEAIIKRRDEVGQFGRAFVELSNSINGIMSNIAEVTISARDGKLYERVDAGHFQGDYRRLITGSNTMLDVFCAHLDAVPEAIALLNGEGMLVYYNHAMSHLLRRHEIAADEVGLLSQLTGGAGAPDIGAGTFTADVSLESIDGPPRHYTLSLEAIASGGYIMILNDVTDLMEAKRRAEAANRSKSEFLSRMSHELLTPMNAIIGSTKLARSTADIERVRAYLDKSGVASTHLLSVVNDILDYSDIESGRLTLNPSVFSLVEAIDACVRETALLRGVTIERDVRLSHTIITTDAARFGQVLSNLVANAVKFSKEDGVVRIEAVESHFDAETNEGIFVFTVIDHGVGIPRGNYDKLFRPFEQADGSLSRAFGGTGLGLVISKHIVEMMGGNISFESAVDEGTTFTFTIRVPASAPSEITPEETSFVGKRVLVVDDVDVNREILSALLEDTGIAIETAENGKVALDAFIAAPVGYYDVILMDMQMPVMDGCAATEAIRALRRPDALITPIIALTANITQDDVQRAKDSGMDEHLAKPVDLAAVLACMGRLMARE